MEAQKESILKNEIPTKDQKNAWERIISFLGSNDSIFILQGYAGTGKTTLIKGIVNHLNENNRQVEVMAPTGRAAKVLRDKVGQGKTIHSSIYNFKDLESINAESQEEADHSVRYFFPIQLDDTDEKVIIVDEASMISAKESKNELFDFGTNVLLDDLLTYAFSNNKNNKVIFVGDPAQLPPVTDNHSFALDEEYLRDAGYACQAAILKEVVRQSDNEILANATTLRKLLNSENRNELQFTYQSNCFEQLPTIDVVPTYLNHFPNPEIGDGVIISYSNSQSLFYNKAIREQLYSDPSKVQPGDLLLINSNNYHTYSVELFNGDIAKVIEVSDQVIQQSAPVWKKKDGKDVRVQVSLYFRKVVLRVPNYDGEIPCYIIDSMLGSELRDLSVDELKALYINFVIRFREEQLEREKKGLPHYKVGSQQFKDQLKKDPFYNALRVKYGYAITCHKAQGGEWDTVFVDYYGRVGLSNDHLRWCYTATTRGVNLLYAINPPTISPLGKLKVNPIAGIKQIGKDAIDFSSIPVSPYHTKEQHLGKSYKYWELLSKLDDTPFSIKNVTSYGEFLERYTFDLGDGREVELQANHNGAGLFLQDFQALQLADDESVQELLNLINTLEGLDISPQYQPSNLAFERLFSLIQEYVEAEGAAITNVVEEEDKYFVKYYLLTDIFSSLQIYFNKNMQFSRVMPQSLLGEKDEKLKKLITKIDSYASQGN